MQIAPRMIRASNSKKNSKNFEAPQKKIFFFNSPDIKLT